MGLKSEFLPEGSSYVCHRRKKRRSWLQHKLWMLRWFIVGLLCKTMPAIYRCYMGFVCMTSKVNRNFGHRFNRATAQGNKFICVLWHQDLFGVPYLFSPYAFHALANTGNAGRFITAILEANNFRVFRGGRKRKQIMRYMIAHMLQEEGVVYGITVDGSKGPRKVMKKGACFIARKTGTPIYLVTSQSKWHIKCPTWDRMAFPLPFNHIETYAVGPYWIDPECSSAEFNIFCDHIEAQLNVLEVAVQQRLKGSSQASVEIADVNQPLGEWDLREDVLPPWAKVSAEVESV